MTFLASRLRGRYRLVGVSLIRSGLTGSETPFPVYTDVPTETAASYGFGSTPQTLILAAGGRVVKVWDGAFSGPIKAEVEKFFSVRLPGLTEPFANSF